MLLWAEWRSKSPKKWKLGLKSSFGPEVVVVCICSLMGRPGPERQIMKIRCFCGLFFPYCETFKLFPEGETEMLLVWGQLCIYSDECATQKNCPDFPLFSMIKNHHDDHNYHNHSSKNVINKWPKNETNKRRAANSLSPKPRWKIRCLEDVKIIHERIRGAIRLCLTNQKFPKGKQGGRSFDILLFINTG